MIIAGKGETAETMVHQGSGDVHYYWTLDLLTSKPDQISHKMLTTAEERLAEGYHRQVPDEMHITLRFKTTPGPDEAYTEKVMKLGPQRITVNAIYTDEKQMAGCSAIISEAAQQRFKGKVPHVLLSVAQLSEEIWHS